MVFRFLPSLYVTYYFRASQASLDTTLAKVKVTTIWRNRNFRDNYNKEVPEYILFTLSHLSQIFLLLYIKFLELQ